MALGKIAVTLSILLSVVGCSTLMRRTPAEGERQMIIAVANKYLLDVSRGNYHGLYNSVLWFDFLQNRGQLLTKEQVLEQVKTVPGRWVTEDENPLRQLRVESLDVRGDKAQLVLRKEGNSKSPKVSVDMLWSGRAWLITHDSLFGKNGLLGSS